MAASSTSTPSSLPPFLQQSKSDLHNKFVDLEWQQRNRLLQGTQATDPPSPWARLNSDAVAPRNRYLNVEPYASNRVKLKVAPGANDYINASPVEIGGKKFIATQGPKDTSVNHFYRMLAAERVGVVVMLTQTHEAGREKCFQYFPSSADESPLRIPLDEEMGDGFTGEVYLESVEEDEKSRSQIRRLRLRVRQDDDDEEQELQFHHLLFSAWPDFLIPEGDDRAALLHLIHLSNQLNNPPTRPRIVHCSAGVGRSGTFIALDHLLTQLHSHALDALPRDRDPVAEAVDLLRQQRMMMVQGEAQFYFLYEVLRELMMVGDGQVVEGAKMS